MIWNLLLVLLVYWVIGVVWAGILYRLIKNHPSWEAKSAFNFAMFNTISWPFWIPVVVTAILVALIGGDEV